MSLLFFFFFFKQKTAYEMRISDWSSDVCSSDLRRTSRGRHSPAKPASAPSVSGPERITGSRSAARRLTSSVRYGRTRRICFPELPPTTVLLPESFRGGCSFGALLSMEFHGAEDLSRRHQRQFQTGPRRPRKSTRAARARLTPAA